LLAAEVDPVVWQRALQIVRQDGRESAQRLAYLALEHASADVRKQACEYLAEHADPRHAALLIPMLHDPSSSVILAAVRAIGAGKAVDDPRPLVEMLVTPDKLLRAEVALALARMHVAEGAAAIERLALETDLQIRLRVATGMGEVCDPAFVPALMTMLDDRPEVQRAALRSLRQIVGADIGGAESSKPAPLDQQIRRWRDWHREQTAVASAT
jgi:HEAT repeat protein